MSDPIARLIHRYPELAPCEPSLVQARNVACYLDSGAPACLQAGHFQIPYPDPVRLQHLLDDPAVRNLLVRCDIAPCQDREAGAATAP